MTIPATDTAPPSSVMRDFIVTLLAPLFLAPAGNNYALARAAALETINEYQARSGNDLLIIAQIVTFSFASLSTLVQSMEEGLPTQLMLRMQARADALTRTADRARKRLEQHHRNPSPAPEPPPPEPMAEVEATPSCADAEPSMPPAEAASAPSPDPSWDEGDFTRMTEFFAAALASHPGSDAMPLSGPWRDLARAAFENPVIGPLTPPPEAADHPLPEQAQPADPAGTHATGT